MNSDGWKQIPARGICILDTVYNSRRRWCFITVFGLVRVSPHSQMKGYTHDWIKGTVLTSAQPLVYLRRVRRLRPLPCALTPMNVVALFAFHLTDIGLRIINSENELIFTTCPRVDIELWSWGVHSEPVYGGLWPEYTCVVYVCFYVKSILFTVHVGRL